MKSILVIDDEDEVRSVIVATLTYAGYSVREARNGRDGILLLLVEKPDLILCDVRMAGMDGYRTLAAVRQVPGTAAIPFILMTGSTRRDECRLAMVCGADDYLVKPFTAPELLGSVRSRLARQSQVQSDVYQQFEKSPALFRRHCSPELAPLGTPTAAACL